MQQKRTPLAGDTLGWPKVAIVAKIVSGLFAEQDRSIRQPPAPNRRGGQNFRRLGPVGHDGGQAIHRQPRGRIQLVLFVSIEERTEAPLHRQVYAGREDVQKAVEDFDADRRIIVIHQVRGPHESKPRAGRPGVPENQAQLPMNLLKHQAVSKRAFIQIPLDERMRRLARKRLPHHGGAAVAANPQQCRGPRNSVTAVKPIDRFV